MMIIALVISSVTALVPQQTAVAVATPTNQTDCKSAGGTWVDNDHINGLCSDLPKIVTMPLIDQARSFADLNGLYDCFYKSSAQMDNVSQISLSNRITSDHVKSGSWWVTTGDWRRGQSAGAETAGSYLNGKTKADHGNTLCNDVLADALATWGYSDGMAFMCSIKTTVNGKAVVGIPRADGSSCQTGNGTDWNLESKYADDMWATVKDVVYGGKEPNWANTASNVNAAKYLLYRNAFLKGCSAKISTTATGDYKYSKVVIISDDGTSTTSDYEGLSSGTQRDIYRIKGDKNDTESCQQIAKNVNKYAPNFSEYLIRYPTDHGTTTQGNSDCTIKAQCSDNDSKTSCVIEGIGWLVCATMNAVSGVVDGLYGLIQGILTVNPLLQTNSDGSTTAQYATWQNIRNIANVLLVIAFLVIIFSQLTSFGVSNYGVKKMLPRIIIVAIAINLSYFVMGLAIDITNIFGTGVKTILDTTGADASLSGVGFENLTTAYLTGATALAIAGTTATIAIGVAGLSASALALLAVPFILGALLAVLAAFATMFIRNALIIVLVIISPIAFAAYLLPNTQSLFDRWRKLFISMLALFPLAALLFGGARLAAYITLSSNQPLGVLIALFIMAAPLGALPFLIKSSNSLLSGINNKLQGYAKSARGAAQRGLKPFVDKQKAQYQAGERNFFGRRQRPGSRRNLAQGFDQRRRSRQLETQNATATAEENWKAAGVAGTGGAGQRAQRALDTQKTLGTRKSANEAQIEERSKRRIADPTTVDAVYEAQSFDAQKGISSAEAITKERNLGRVQANFASTSAAAGGERLGTIDRQQFGSDEVSKTLDMQIKRANMESGIASDSIQAQKAAELGIKATEAEEQKEFDEGVQRNDDTVASTQRLDAASRLSGAATAETKQMLDEQADGTLDLRQADERKQNAEFVSASIAGNNKTTLAQEQQIGGSLFDATMNNAANSKQQETLGKQSDQLVAEATTNSDAPHLDVIDSAARAAMQQANENARIATSGTEAANRVATQEYADSLINNSGVAADAGGIDPQGETLVVAQAIETQRKAYDSNVAAYGVRLRQAGTPDSVAFTLGRPDQAGDNSLLGIAMDTRRTAEEREAAGRAIVAASNIDAIVPYQDYLATALANTPSNTPEYTAIQSLQKAYAETVPNSPGKPMGLGAVDLANFRTGTYIPPTPAVQLPGANVANLSVSDIQTLNTVVDKGVSMDGWATMDKSDIARISDLAERGLIPQERLETMWDSLNTALSDVRWYGRIKEREQQKLEALMAPDASGVVRIPTPAGKHRKARRP